MLRILTIETRPLWSLGISRGRWWVRQAVSDDVSQCLSYAGLLDETPGKDAVDWWDDLAAIVRTEEGLAQVERGREGEFLTIRYESDRLAKLGLGNRQPRWIAVEDNLAGFDVLSWDRDASGSVHEFRIEVKAYSSAARFFLSRNEWNTANRFAPWFAVYLWNLAAGGPPTILSVGDLDVNVPVDRGRGAWQAVEIELEA